MTENTATSSTSGSQDIKFTGSGSEYFRVWIVNLLLTILTLGIYSAWAKVRTTQYFYSNTHVAGSSFEYMAKPLSILLGRIIAVIFFGVLYFVGTKLQLGFDIVWISIYVGLMVALILAAPWIIVKAILFKARNTAYRNVRFSFRKAYGQSYGVFIGWNILSAITLTILAPVLWAKQQEFIMNNLGYGTTRFNLKAKIGEYYVLWLKLIGVVALFVGIIFGSMLLMQDTIMAAVRSNDPAQIQSIQIVMGIVIYAIAIPMMVFMTSLFKANITNIVWNNTNLSDNKFFSEMKTSGLIKIYFKNGLLILFTLGIYTPWARTNIIKYRLSKTKVAVSDNFDNFVAEAEKKQANSFAEGMDDVFGFEVQL